MKKQKVLKITAEVDKKNAITLKIAVIKDKDLLVGSLAALLSKSDSFCEALSEAVILLKELEDDLGVNKSNASLEKTLQKLGITIRED